MTLAELGYISIHAPSRERPCGANGVFREVACISIHAPSRERPFNAIILLPPCNISIHAPSRERPPPAGTGLVSVKQFQSTLPRGSDQPMHLAAQSRMPYFNPRSLAGATISALCTSSQVILFQSTLPRGSDQICASPPSKARIFQSTLPRGSDRRVGHLRAQRHKFQSTLPRGSDRGGGSYAPGALRISIHAPSRERPAR